jgi:DNA modification methylase
MADVRLILGDCRTVTPDVPVAAVVSDPPYGMDWNTDSTRFTGGNRDLRPVEGRDDWGDVAGDSEPFDPSPWLTFPKCILWGANHYAARLPIGTTLVWIKKNDVHFRTFLSDGEIGWMKGGHGVYCFRKLFPPPSRISEGNGEVLHPTQKPLALMRWCLTLLDLSAGSWVYDPYMGSGTTGVACMEMDLNFIGVEIHEPYFRIAEKRIAAERAKGNLFEGVK